jgi:hypothetical protein
MLRKALCLFAVTVFSANTQTINLQGVVSNSGGKPISNAIVSLVRQKMKDTTDADGKFSFSGTTVANLPAIVPQSTNIFLRNKSLQFDLSTQAPLKIEIFDLKGNLLQQEMNANAPAGVYNFEISKNCQAAKVLIVKASIGKSEVSFRYMALKDGLYASTPLASSAIFSSAGLVAAAAVVDTIKVTATGYQPKAVAITSLNNQQQNISLDTSSTKEFPTANPAAKGPFEITEVKNVGPLAGVIPDPIYKNEQQRFNVYFPKNLATSGYLHPILIWANGYTDNPEQNPPLCITDSKTGRWCGQYLPMMQHLASHGFVVVASLSTATGSTGSDGLLPTIVGMEWIVKQNDSLGSLFYHRLDTTKIGQLGHSFGGMSTCKSAANPRYKALMTICGTNPLSGVHTPMLFFCGGKDGTVACSGVKNTYLTVKDQPAFFLDELNSDHGSWVYQGPNGVSLSAAAAWFRFYLMNDTAARDYFYGPNCKFCKDSRVTVEQNSLMKQ